MKNYIALLAGLGVLAGCADAPTHPATADAAAPSFSWGVDNDGDGIDDGTEWELAHRFAPVLYMPNLITRADASAGVAGDWGWPSTVAWYLPRVRMRIHHNNCADHQLLDVGQVNTTSLLQQSHQRFVLKWYGCVHESPYQYSDRSWHDDDHYFLQSINDDVVHPGMRDPATWQTYFHAYRNTIGGVSIQYWVFYPYNDFVASANHEGDWEHINVRLNASQQVDAVFYAQHNTGVVYTPAQVSWYGGTHPQVWVADGSHASYRAEADCDNIVAEGGDNSCWTNNAQRWFTWGGDAGSTDAGIRGAGLVNMGEALTTTRKPMSGQEWIRYSGRWGEVGETGATSGPRGPAYQANWNRDAAL